MKILAKNKRAYFDYEILETFEAGISLLGFEVKSIKASQLSLDNAFANFYDGDLYLLNAHIPAWQPKNAPKDFDPTRSRKLLLHKKELKYLLGKIREARLVLIPLSFLLKNNKIKVELGLGKSRRKIDKRELIRKREVEREIDRHLKS
jgi:SsrA-binding protein